MGQLVVEQQEHGELVATELEADALIIDPDKLAPLALFAVEAIGNAQKHALAVRGGLLRVQFVSGEEVCFRSSTTAAALRRSWRDGRRSGADDGLLRAAARAHGAGRYRPWRRHRRG